MALDEQTRIAADLDDCRRRMQAGEPLDQCLAAYPADSQEEIRRLMPLVQRVERLAHDPSPELVDRLEQRLLAAVAETRRTQRTGILARIESALGGFAGMPARRSLGLALAALVLIAASGFGVVQASATSLPDSPLYRVQELRDQAQILLAQNQNVQTEVRVRQLANQSNQLDAALRTGKPPRVTRIIAVRMNQLAVQMTNQSLTARARGNVQPALRVEQTLQATQGHVGLLWFEAPKAQRPVLQKLQVALFRQELRFSPNRGAQSPSDERRR